MTTLPTETDKVTAQADIVLALCCECGAIRSVARRAAGRDRTLRCEVCKRTTMHAPVGADPVGDWRERTNQDSPPKLGVDEMLDVLRALGADIKEGPVRASNDKRGVIKVVWWFDGTFDITVDRATLSEQHLVITLREVAEHLADPRRHAWYVIRDGSEAVAGHIVWTIR